MGGYTGGGFPHMYSLKYSTSHIVLFRVVTFDGSWQ